MARVRSEKSRIALIALLAPVALIGWCTVRDHQLDSAFPKIKSEMSTEQVIGLMGTPSWDTACFAGKYNSYGAPKPGCAREMGFFGSLGGFPDGYYYLVWFDASGKVMDTAPIHSP